jgi:hypothetical protein
LRISKSVGFIAYVLKNNIYVRLKWREILMVSKIY